jgi:hypothetical protein
VQDKKYRQAITAAGSGFTLLLMINVHTYQSGELLFPCEFQ